MNVTIACSSEKPECYNILLFSIPNLVSQVIALSKNKKSLSLWSQ